MPDPTNTQISMNIAIAVLHTHIARSNGLPGMYDHYQELAEALIQYLGPDTINWAKRMVL